MTCKTQNQTSKPTIKNDSVIQGLYGPDETERFWALMVRVIFARERKNDDKLQGEMVT